jgi:hypothetical protein
MTPSLANREVIHLPGPVTLGIFTDLGWETALAVEATVSPTPESTSTPTPPSGSAAQATPKPTYAFFEYLPSIFSLAPTKTH